MAKIMLSLITAALIACASFTIAMDTSTPEYQDLMKYLHEKGAMSWFERDVKFSLMRAANAGYFDMCKLLIAAKADIHQENMDGSTALTFASTPLICQLLIDARADINHQCTIGMTKLMRVARGNNPEMCKFLIDAQADVNFQAKGGDTALLHAVACDSPQICKLLIEAHANIYLRSHKGTPLLANVVSNGVLGDLKAKVEITQLILNASSQLSEQDKRSLFTWYLVYNRLQDEGRGLSNKDLKRYIARSIQQLLAQDLYDNAIRAGAGELLKRGQDISALVKPLEEHLNLERLKKVVCMQSKQSKNI